MQLFYWYAYKKKHMAHGREGEWMHGKIASKWYLRIRGVYTLYIHIFMQLPAPPQTNECMEKLHQRYPLPKKYHISGMYNHL